MMDDGSAAALQGFVALSQSTRGKAAAALIQRAVSKPGLYVFGELLEQPTIASVREVAVLVWWSLCRWSL